MYYKAFLMKLKPGNQEEYERRHNPIWPELQQVLKEHGVHHYAIFLDRGSDQLFAYVELESEDLWPQIAQTEIFQRWWEYMQDIMLTHSDNSPHTVFLDRVFDL